MKVTAIAPSNIAFIKYWGRKDETLKLPSNSSISMNLSGLTTTTTVEFSPEYKEDSVVISSSSKAIAESRSNNETINQSSNGDHGSRFDPLTRTIKSDPKVIAHLNRIRKLAGISEKAKVVSQNSFPHGTGLSSSASGFAALTLAAAKAAGLDLSEKELSILARQGSGSACRSIPDGFVEWLDGDTSETSYAVSLHTVDYWDIVDIAVILTDQMKDVSTTEGQKLASTSIFFETRLANLKQKTEDLKHALAEKEFKAFGEITEAEALEMHAIMLTSKPSLIYWYPATITLMKAVQSWRKDGLVCYFTLNTGQNMHILCMGKDIQEITNKLKDISDVKGIIENRPAKGAMTTLVHLF